MTQINKVIASLLVLYSQTSLAQTDVEVGKHANVNLDAFSMIISLFMVLALIIASAWILKKFNLTQRSASGMKVITSLPVGHKEKLIVVQVGDEQLLIGVSQQQVTLLKVLDTPLTMEPQVSQDISQSLSKFLTKSTRNK